MAAKSLRQRGEDRTITLGWYSPRIEWFCRFIALGCGPTAAARLAGLDANKANAHRAYLQYGRPERVLELRNGKDPWMRQARARLLPPLEELRAAAMAGHQFEIAIRAIMLMALIAGVTPLALPMRKGESRRPSGGVMPFGSVLNMKQAIDLGFLQLCPSRKASRKVSAKKIVARDREQWRIKGRLKKERKLAVAAILAEAA